MRFQKWEWFQRSSKFVLDALIDTLNINLNKGISVQLGDFGQFRPGISSESQETEAAVDSDTIRRVKSYLLRDTSLRIC